MSVNAAPEQGQTCALLCWHTSSSSTVSRPRSDCSRYADNEAVAVLDRATAGNRSLDHVTAVQDGPHVATIAEAPACDALFIRIAPIGGGLADN